ncbi:hypothetical protein M3J09_013454 [Ascochyta lentis]
MTIVSSALGFVERASLPRCWTPGVQLAARVSSCVL